MRIDTRGSLVVETDKFWEPDDDDWNPLSILGVILLLVVIAIWATS